MKQFLLVMFVTGIAILGAGCGNGDHLPTVAAGGSVVLDGKPLPKAMVIFTPQQGRSATALTEADGNFTLSTYGNGDGAVVGHHRVSVLCREEPQDDPKGSPLLPRPGKTRIDPSYSSNDTSGLAFDVVAGQQNSFSINVSAPTVQKQAANP